MNTIDYYRACNRRYVPESDSLLLWSPKALTSRLLERGDGK